MKKFIIAMIMLSLIFTLFACQPTPTEDIIVNKGDGDKNPTIDAMIKKHRRTLCAL